MNMKYIAAVATALLASTSSMAMTTAWGIHDPLEVASPLAAPGLIDDFFTFTIGGTSSVASTAVATNVAIPPPVSLNVLQIDNGTYSLWSNADGIIGNSDDLQLGSWSFSGITGSVSNQVTPLLAGIYYYSVKGLATGLSGGQYTLASSVSAVPEPETLAMMLAGLGAVGFIAMRRRRD